MKYQIEEMTLYTSGVTHPTLEAWRALKAVCKLLTVGIILKLAWNLSNGWHFFGLVGFLVLLGFIGWYNRI